MPEDNQKLPINEVSQPASADTTEPVLETKTTPIPAIIYPSQPEIKPTWSTKFFLFLAKHGFWGVVFVLICLLAVGTVAMEAIAPNSYKPISNLLGKSSSSSSSSSSSNYSSSRSSSQSSSFSSSSSQQSSSSSSSISIPEPLFSGTITKLDKDLGLIKPDQDNNPKPVYYEAGVLNKGKYQSYHRILLTYSYGMGGQVHEFLTKDYSKYILINAINYSDSVIPYKYKPATTLTQVDQTGQFLNAAKIVAVESFEEELPESIKLSDQFTLVKQQSNFGLSIFNFVSSDNDLSLITDYSKLTKLEVKDSNYKIYSRGVDLKVSDDVLKNYFDQYAEVVISDSTGLAYGYNLTWNSSISGRLQAENDYLVQQKIYNDFLDRSANLRKIIDPNNTYSPEIEKEVTKQLGKTPEYPTLNQLDLSFEGDQLNSLNNNLFYKSYFKSFPNFAIYNNYIFKNINSSELEKVATKDGLDVFKLKDFNHELYQLEYKTKIKQEYPLPDGTFSSIFKNTNSDVEQPSYKDYVAKNPLLFFKDPFDRLIGLGEWDYKIAGGLGKPVVYLYPSQQTQVNVKFTAPMLLTTDIPKYDTQKGWNVLAKPSGELTDLQPNITNCRQFTNPHVGSEYAQSACQNNDYPYIYWAGFRLNGNYPVIDKGWLVAKPDLEGFLNQKLDYIGLNATEKKDMLEYWLPYLSNQSGDYLRISFLQTKEMNSLAPMQITPTPDKLFRVFLDWQSYEQKPELNLQTQDLEVLGYRPAFTVLEWGGLKK
jgi:hypothetical protein